MPIAQSRVTAIGYHAAGPGALRAEAARPAGEPGRGHAVLPPPLRRRRQRPALLPGLGRHRRPDGRARRRRCDRHRRLLAGRRDRGRDRAQRPRRASATASGSTSSPRARRRSCVSLTHLRIDPSLAVGDAVIASSSKLGRGARLLRSRAAVARALHAGRRQPRGDPGASRPRRCRCPERSSSSGTCSATAGRRAVEERLPGLREELDVDFCVVNGENAADGARDHAPARRPAARRRRRRGHARQPHLAPLARSAPYLERSERVIRPANFASATPGRGLAVAPVARRRRRSR